jgi:biopolymer transport protein ExbB
MLDNKRKTPFIALLGAMALMASAPAFAQNPAPAAPAADAAAAPAAEAAPAAPAAPAAEPAEPAKIEHAGKLTPIQMFLDAEPVVKVVMIGLILASIFSWTLLVTKIFEFGSLNKKSDAFLESFRGARTIADINRISSSEEFEGNPMADMAAAASQEVELSKQAGLSISGDHRDSTILRAVTAVNAVQAALAKRLGSGMTFLASVGSAGPFIGLFGTVYGIMNSFIGIANTNTTNLAVVAPGIAEALLATGIGLFAAIPAVIFYNYFQTRISAYGTRSEGFVAELTNAISRQLDKGA